MRLGLSVGSERSNAFIGIALALVLVAVAGVTDTGRVAADVVTVSSDNARTGWDSHEPGLTPSAVSSSDFGQIFSTAVDGQVYAQPLLVNGTLIVTTENNKAYGLDPESGSIRWSRNLGPAWPASAITCGDLVPNVGSTSGPVYDPGSGAVYFTAKVNDGPDLRHPHYYMHAVDPGSGGELTGWPMAIAGAPANDPSMPFDPMVELQRTGLLLLDGVVYAGFGSHCDHGNYRGYIVGVSTATHTVSSMWATETGASNQGGGVWQSGSGLMSDGAGRIFVATGNGITPPAGPGAKPPGTLSESVTRLQVKPDKSVTAADFFSPTNADTLDVNDTDLASGGPVALPDSFGTASHPHVLFEQGKDGRVFLLDRDGLGGRAQGGGGTDSALNIAGPFEGLWGHPAVWTGEGGYVYTVGNGGPLRALKSGVSGGGLPALSAVGASADVFPYSAGSPVITSAGTTPGSGVVWVVWSNGPAGGNAQLRAYAAVPDSTGGLPLLWAAPIGTAVKFAVPATNGGRVYVGTRDGHVIAFGRPAVAALNASPVDFGSVAVGATTTKTATITATKALKVTGITTTTPFTVTAPPLPVSLNAGDQLSLPVSFTPGAPGATSQILSVTTDHGSFGFSLSGTATQPGLQATPAAVTFARQAVGATSTVNVQITNTGTGDETVSGVTGPDGPFTAGGLPASGAVLKAGASQVFTVTYQPAAAGSSSSSITITSTSGKLAIPVSGSAVVGSGKLVVTPGAGVDFGQVPAGTARDLTFDLTNTGNLPVTVSLAKAPASDFTSRTPLSEGVVVGPGQVVHQQVTFRPSKPGAQSDRYQINGGDGQGVQTVRLTGMGSGGLPGPNAADWSVNGSASITDVAGQKVQLTPAQKYKAGTYIYRRPVPTDGMNVSFTTQIGQGTGADGMSFMMLDPATTSPASLGASGGGLGFQGLKGAAVTLVATRTSNYVGIAVSSGSGPYRYVATAPVRTSLRSGTHSVAVRANGGHIAVWIDRKKLLDKAMPARAVPANALVGWGAGTSYRTDVHTVIRPWVNVYAAPGRALVASLPSVDFRRVKLSTSAAATLTLTNSGGSPEQVTSVAAPTAPFSATLPAVGTTIQPGASVTVPLVFRPTGDGTVTQSLAVTTTSGTVVVPLNGTGEDTLPDLTTSSWSYSGYATLAGTTVTLTADGQYSGAGLLVNAMPIVPKGLHATFTAQLRGSQRQGADGLTFALLDASAGKPSAPGHNGSGLGVAGLPAVFAALDTYGPTSHNFAGVGTSTAGATAVTFLKTTTAVPPLRTGTHAVDVTISDASHMIVTVDGQQVLDVPVTLPPRVLVAFTAGVGGLTDTHAVLNPVITYTG